MKKIITLIMIGSIIMTSCEKQPDVAVVSTRYGDMVLEFYPEVAEKHVDSFLTPVSYTHLTLPTTPYV